MKFSPGILCGLMVSAIVVAGLQTNCPKECNCSTNLDVRCLGHSMADVTAKVPSNTLFYTYTGLENVIDLGSVEFMHLERLQNLTINTKYDYNVFDRKLNFSNSSQAVFKPLSNLKNLSIRITWNMSQPMPEMFSYLNNLENLDLSFTRLINYKSLQQSLKGLKDNHVLRRINLKNTQVYRSLINGLRFNLSYFLEPIAHCPLQYLDLSYNSIKSIYPGLIRFAPNVTEIIVSNNLITPFLNSAFALEVILHPSLEKADFSQQFHPKIPPNIRSLPTKSSLPLTQGFSLSKRSMNGPVQVEESPVLKNSTWFKTRDSVKELSMTLRNLPKYSNCSFNDCVDNLTDAYNVCIIFQPECTCLLELFREEHTLVCLLLTKFFGEESNGIPCNYIPPIDELLQKDCFACVVFPSVGNLKELAIHELISYDQTKLPTVLINKTKCFHPNKIQRIDFSRSYPLGFSDIDLILQSPITGLNDLRVLNLSGCGLIQPYYNFSALVQNLTSVDLSHNKLTFEEYDGEKYLIGPPLVTYFNLAGNAIRDTPQNTLRTMHALETLNLDNNHLSEFAMDLTYLPNLRNLSLQSNLIQSLSKSTMEQFNEHAQKSQSKYCF